MLKLTLKLVSSLNYCLYPVLLHALISCVFISKAGEYDNELMRFDFEIEVAGISAAAPEVDFQILVDKSKLSLPVTPPTLTLKQVEIKIEHDLNEIVEKYFPSTQYRKIKAEAEEKFKMYEIGDSIKILRQYGKQKVEVSSRLEAKWIPQNVMDQAAKAAAQKAIEKEQPSLLGQIKGFFKTKIEAPAPQPADNESTDPDFYRSRCQQFI